MVTYLGSLVQLCCKEGGILQTNITGMCGECSQCLGHTGFAPAHGVWAFPVYTTQAPGCSAGDLFKAGPRPHALPRSQPLSAGSWVLHRAQTRLGMCFVPVPGRSRSGDQGLAESTVPGGPCVLSPPWSRPLAFPGCTTTALSWVCPVSPLGS